MSSIETHEPDRCLFMIYGHDPAYLERAGGDLNIALDLLHKDFPAKTFRGLQLKSMIGSLFPLAPVPSNFQEILEPFGFRFSEEYAAIWHMACQDEYPLSCASTEDDVLLEKRMFQKIANSFHEFIDSLEVGPTKVKS